MEILPDNAFAIEARQANIKIKRLDKIVRILFFISYSLWIAGVIMSIALEDKAIVAWLYVSGLIISLLGLVLSTYTSGFYYGMYIQSCENMALLQKYQNVRNDKIKSIKPKTRKKS